jgi:dihydroorotase
MSELLHLGVPLERVIEMVTSNPAKLLRMEDELGCIAVGREADISVLKIETGRFKLSDNSGENVTAEKLIRPAFCLRAGKKYDATSAFVPDAIVA